MLKVRFIAFCLVVTAITGFVGVRARVSSNDTLTPEPQASRRAPAEAEIAQLEQTVRDRPQDIDAQTRLAALYLQRARETGDATLYRRAHAASETALAIDPDNVNAIVVAGANALALHDFDGALVLGERARELNPDVVASYGVITDALVELGRYDEAIAAAQEMVDRRPDFASYSRVSYLRELHGDTAGAIAAMELAASAGAGRPFDAAWSHVLLGNLHLANGDIDAAARAYEQADAVLPGDPMTQAGLARLAVARGDLPTAEQLLQAAVAVRPLPEYAIALGDLQWSQGRAREAEDQYALVRATQQLFAASGVDTDIELALFDADHDVDPARTYDTALAAYGRRPSVYSADTVAWAAFKAGRLDDAVRYIAEAQRIGTRDPRIAYHAGVIAQATGDLDAATRHFADAVAMEPAQSLRYRAAARAAHATVTAAP